MAEKEKTRVVIIGCERIKDRTCIACTKCFKAARENAGKFEGLGDIEVVGLTSCGDCPGLVVPKMNLVNEVIEGLGEEFDKIFLGTCMVAAVNNAYCPVDLDEQKAILEGKFGKEVIIGTHPW